MSGLIVQICDMLGLNPGQPLFEEGEVVDEEFALAMAVDERDRCSKIKTYDSWRSLVMVCVVVKRYEVQEAGTGDGQREEEVTRYLTASAKEAISPEGAGRFMTATAALPVILQNHTIEQGATYEFREIRIVPEHAEVGNHV